MKKLLSILLCVALLLTLTPSVFAADGYYNVLSDNEWKFSESTDVATYGSVGNKKGGSVVELVSDSSLTGQNDTVLKLTRATQQTDGVTPGNINISFLMNGTASEVKVKFNFKVSNTNALFKYVLRQGDPDSGDFIVLQAQSGTVKFLNSNVDTYKAGTWYDVEMLFNIPKAYGQLKIKEHSAAAWKTYNVVADEVVPDASKNIKFGIWTHISRLVAGVQNNPGEVYIDNYYQNTADVPAAFLGSDDFSAGIDGWGQGNVTNNLYANHTVLDGNGVLEIKADSAAANQNAYIYKEIDDKVTANAALDTNYHFKFKFGGNVSKSTIGASIRTDGGTATYQEIFIVKNISGRMAHFGGTSQNNNIKYIDEFGAWDNNAIYDVEGVYNPSTGTMTSVITNTEGKQFIAADSSGLISGLPIRFAFRNSAAKGDSSVAYFDDFETDILDTNGPAFDSSDVLSGDKNCASLDETAVFTYDRTINQAALADATVTLEGQTLSADKYTITSKGAQVFVSVKGLEKGKSYTVGLSGVKDILGTPSKDATVPTVTFTTSDTDIIATNPVLNLDTKMLTTNVTSYYAQGKAIKLIVAVYDSAETTIEAVKVVEKIVSNRTGEDVTADFTEILSGDLSGKKIKGFVWSDFSTMIPYAEAYHN